MQLDGAVEHRVAVAGDEVRVVSAGLGSPAVLFDSALGLPLEAWSLIAPTIATRQQVVLWDRPGIGGSGPPIALDAEAMASAMASVVRSAGQNEVVVVGHSRGGIHALAFAAFHPDLVAGLVFVESSHPDQLNRMPKGDGRLPGAVRLLSNAPRPFARVLAQTLRLVVRARGDRARPAVKAMAGVAPALFARLDGFVAEHENGPALLAGVASAIADRGVPDVPIVVLTGDENFSDPADQEAWDRMHAELAALGAQGRRIHVACGHELPFSNPDAVIDAITAVCQAAGSAAR